MSRTRVIAVVAAFTAAAAASVVIVASADEDDGGGHDEDLLDRAEAIEADVAELRGLDVKRPIQRGVMSREQIRERLLERIADEYTDEELAREALAMKRLGLLPRDADYKDLVVDILTDQIAGFYDPSTAELYLAGWRPEGAGAAQQDLIMAHEIDHALQDQHFDLERFMKLDEDNGDASVARQALVEGDGTALMIEYAVSRSGAAASPWGNDAVMEMIEPTVSQSVAAGALSSAPLIIREGLLFPYVGGLRFVAHFRKHHSWKRIDRIYRKPPLSTEHILHPDTYVAYERPDRIRARPVPSLEDHVELYDNVNGELGLSIVLREHGVPGPASGGGPSKAELAAAGWGGDRWLLYGPGDSSDLDDTVAVLYTVWDDEADAVEFWEVLVDHVGPGLAGPGARAVDGEGDRVKTWRSSKRAVSAERRGDAVVLVVAPAKAGAGAIRSQVLKSWKVERR